MRRTTTRRADRACRAAVRWGHGRMAAPPDLWPRSRPCCCSRGGPASAAQLEQQARRARAGEEAGLRGHHRPRRGAAGARPGSRGTPARRGRARRLPAGPGRLRGGQDRRRRDAEPDDVRHVTEILDDGRYAIACVRARAAGEPLPTRRPPCFFDPRHGLSVTDVPWTPPGGATRDVPACALDAERVAAGADPDSRMVMVGLAAGAVLPGRRAPTSRTPRATSAGSGR